MAALIIACADGRIADPVSRLLESLELTAADRMFVPGGPLVLTRPGMERRVAMHCIADMVDVHAARRIILVSHQDCSFYERALGGLGFDQQELLERDLRRVKMLIENDFPEIAVSCYVIPWRENGAGGAAFGEAEPVD